MSSSSSVSPVSIIPAPVSVWQFTGRHVLCAETRILVAHSSLVSVAGYLQSVLRKVTGWTFEIIARDSEAALPNSERVAAPHFHLAHTPSVENPEGYRLRVASQYVRIEASAPAGAFYAMQTLLQLLPPVVHLARPRRDVAWTLPCLQIEDAPRFQWRGAMLDSCRHFQPVSFIYKFLDLLALHKLNTFHWHLTEDQGWRIEIRKYPRLTEIGSRRAETVVGHNDFPLGGDGIPHGGFYTQDEIRAIVAYAAERFITIVPEIEMPGHATAAIAAYPQFGCTLGHAPVEVAIGWGVFTNLYSPEEATFSFLQDVLDEVLALFPSRYIHVGGDEAAKDQWLASESVQQRMCELGVPDVHSLQSYFIGRMARFLDSRGRRLIGWDEILEGGLPDGTTVMSWRGTQGGIDAASAGHDVVMAPHQYTYFDSAQSLDSAIEPLAISGPLTLEKVYSFEPVPSQFTGQPEKAARIMGVQAQIWTEYIPTPEHVEYMAFPRLSALAEVAWTSREKRDAGSFEEFRSRLVPFLKRLTLLGVRYRPLDLF
ncbi:MAG TPA: beta-N-acetylhexosaminidase [Candidatus Methylacidiphilales bacterium]|nr:beta-N-acetylhexosaminidase [Candidatus Methylacidiphilales bacterium]